MNETMSLSKHEENQIILYPKLCKFTNSLVCPILKCLILFYILFAMNVIHMTILKALYIQQLHYYDRQNISILNPLRIVVIANV